MTHPHVVSIHDHFSYSQISTFKMCREQYKIVYIDGVRKDAESLEAFMGKCVHATLEWLYLPRNMNKLYVTFDRVCQKYDEIWMNLWHERVFISDPKCTTDGFYTIGKRCLANYYNKYGPTFEQGVVGVEVELEFTLAKDYHFRGVIDRLDHPEQGKWTIHDYKTGKHVKSERTARSDLQLAIYQIAVLENFEDVNEIILKWHYLRTGSEVTIVHNGDDIKRFKRRLIREVDKILDLTKDPGNLYPNESILCNWCYRWEECSAKTCPNPAKGAS